MKKLLTIVTLMAAVASLSFAASRKAEKGFMVQNEGTLWVQNANGEVVYSTDKEKGASLAAGTEITVYPEEKLTATLLTNGGKNKTENAKFVRVAYSGKEYWALSNRVTTGGTKGLVLTSAVTYATLNPADFNSAVISPLTTVVVRNTYPVTNNISFTQISFYNEARYRVETVYIRNGKVSTKADDVKAVEIMAKIKASDDSAVKEALIDAALKLSVSQVINSQLLELDSVIHGSDLSGSIEDISAYRVIYTGDGSKVNYRDLPGSKGNVIGQLEDGSSVYVTGKTVMEETIGDATSCWYRFIDNDKNAVWFFGAFSYEADESSSYEEESYDYSADGGSDYYDEY